MIKASDSCELCMTTGGEILWESPVCRIVRVDDPNYPGFCRVIWNAHTREMTDLEPAQQQHLMSAVFAAEAVVRRLFAPDKINLASFGNMVPHLHWHVIPRWQNDKHFPEPIWGSIQRLENPNRRMVSHSEWAAALNETLNMTEAQN